MMSVTIKSVGVSFVALIVYVALLPAISSLITLAVPYLSDNVMSLWLIQLLPLIILISIIFYVFRDNPQQQYYG